MNLGLGFRVRVRILLGLSLGFRLGLGSGCLLLATAIQGLPEKTENGIRKSSYVVLNAFMLLSHKIDAEFCLLLSNHKPDEIVADCITTIRYRCGLNYI